MKKIYVASPAYYKTGGTELLHQLVFQLNKNGYPATIAYVDCEKFQDNLINPSFLEYVSEYVNFYNLIDEKDNVIIVPEINCNLLEGFENAIKVIWWLSVDNFIRECGFKGRIQISGLRRGLGGSIKRILKKEYKNIEKDIYLADFHFCQSYYAIDFLKKKGIALSSIKYLSDYINDLYIENYYKLKNENIIRKDVVLYNPQKGFEFTKKMLSAAPDINWIPLKNLNNNQVIELMQTSKLYIDFGNHPGKDRMPREAVVSGCCIITGMRGAANNDKDVNIPKEYKFDENTCEIDEVISKIRYVLANYKQCINDFQDYTDKILQEKNKFVTDMKMIFSNIVKGI